ncbi:MAG: hypothetical protein CME65_15465 [Halobacteriovoraceae bacterium]|nr:hypothetical protein [Halobacteriovoraceae bacterium]|tara:strand:+ start:9782 stop:12508 length:2727 start_codon:yes stop_codon:yes gene_type:complete
MFNKRRIHISLKLWQRRLQRSQKLNLYLGGAVVLVLLSSVLIYQNIVSSRKTLSTFTQWQYYQTKYDLEGSNSYRSIASANQCAFNDVNYQLIQSEISELEKYYQTGSTLEGKFYGLDLSKLPSIGAQLLADYKDLIGDQVSTSGYDFSQCSDVPCVLNKLYQDQSGLSGLITYYWYLKTGSMISMSNYLPEQENSHPGTYDKKQFSYQDYLFDRQELKKFYFLAKSLPEKLTFIPLMKSIHKVPVNARIEQASNQCAFSLPKGQILLHNDCTKGESKNFFISLTREIAKYVDRQEGFSLGGSSVSHSKYWLDVSQWRKRSLFNPYSKKTESKWISNLTNNDYVDEKSRLSPIEQFASIVAYYRFDPQTLINRTPNELVKWVKKEIYHDKVYDPSGLYAQYMHDFSNKWSLQEVGIWKKCMDEHITPEKTMQEHQRELANTIDHPLYQCVEKQIPGFISYGISEIKQNFYEGCQFFSEINNIQYGHQLSRFHNNIEKYIAEKVLQRKIELKRHGPEVLIGYEVKQKFIETVDPKAVYIGCFDHQAPKHCFDQKMKSKLNQIVLLHPSMSNYYKKTLELDILQLFPFDKVESRTNEVAKQFLAPYSARLNQAATKMWDSCKSEGRDSNVKLDFPLAFSGGRYFVNPKLVNCINRELDSSIYKMAELKAFHRVNDEVIEFKLESKEQSFALSFLQGKLLQTLNNILEKDYLSEKIRLTQHFKEASLKALGQFSDDHDTFFANVFSFKQVRNICLQKITNFYPENYFYHPKEQLDIKFGTPLCDKFVNLPFVKSKLNSEVSRQWQLNREFVEDKLVESYQTQVDNCYDDNPVIKADSRRPSSVASLNRRNKDRRDSCLEISYLDSIDSALSDWRGHKNYDYFAHRESELYSYLKQMERKYVGAAQSSQRLR